MAIDPKHPLQLLGGLSASQFMRRHWQKKPLLVRRAIPHFEPPITRAALFALAARDDVESRLVQMSHGNWKLRHGPFQRRALPSMAMRCWTLLVQGVDLHDEAAHRLLQQFRFLPEARLDDLMISYATDGGGVGPHFDSYDVFLLQAHGRRRWRIGRQKNFDLVEELPLKILANFEPEDEYVLEPGDMLYLPPRYAHEGTAEGECTTYSIGFNSPIQDELSREILLRLADDCDDAPRKPSIYRDARQSAVDTPGAVPEALQLFAHEALNRVLAEPSKLNRVLGEYLTEPKANIYFEPGRAPVMNDGIRLDRRSRMMYDTEFIFINGESYQAAGKDAQLMHRLADERSLTADELKGLSREAARLLFSWCDAGWAYSPVSATAFDKG